MKYKINKGFIAQKLGNKTTIFDGEESILYTFNETGSVIFEKLKLGWDKDKIVDHIVKYYFVSKQKAQNDIEELIKELLRSKVILKN